MRNVLSKRILSNATLMLLSSVLSVSAIEIFLTFMAYPPEELLRNAHPPFRSEHMKHAEYQYDFRTNSIGLRNQEIPPRTGRDVTRIFLAGDSIVEGIGVQEHETISAYLQEALTKQGQLIDCINGGLSGTSIYQRGRLIFHVTYQLDIDAILLFIYDNDIVETFPGYHNVEQMHQIYKPVKRSGIRKQFHLFWPRFSILVAKAWTIAKGIIAQPPNAHQSQEFWEQITPLAQKHGVSLEEVLTWKEGLGPFYRTLLENHEISPYIFSLGFLRPNYWSGSIDLDTPEFEERWALFLRLLNAIIDETLRRHIEIGVVYVPSKFQYDPTAHQSQEPWIVAGATIREAWLQQTTPIRIHLESWAQQRQIPYFDLTPFYREAVAQGMQLNWKLDEHLNKTGNQFTAKVLANWLKKE